MKEAPRRSLRVLRQREILALLIDKPMPGGGVEVRFFGGRIAIPAGAALLSLRTDAPIVPCCVFRLPRGRFVAEVAAPIDPTGFSDARALTQSVVDVLEGWVRRHPEQWYPFRKMFVDGEGANACRPGGPPRSEPNDESAPRRTSPSSASRDDSQRGAKGED